MTSTWKHERFSKNGGVGGRGLRRTLSASGLKEAHRLGRESPREFQGRSSIRQWKGHDDLPTPANHRKGEG